ncbi:MAG: hypothetical protein R2713_19155 [Ilumatobacteraceae bacterium]
MTEHDDRPPSRFDVDRQALGTLLAGEPRYRVDQVWQGLYEQLAEPHELTTLPKALRARLDDALPLALREELRRVSDRGDTIKYLWQLHDGHRIETVLMLYPDRVTACVSSQAGCAMDCSFCATGQAGSSDISPPARSSNRWWRRTRGSPARAAARQRGVHGHGRAARERGCRVGCDRTHPR